MVIVKEEIRGKIRKKKKRGILTKKEEVEDREIKEECLKYYSYLF